MFFVLEHSIICSVGLSSVWESERLVIGVQFWNIKILQVKAIIIRTSSSNSYPSYTKNNNILLGHQDHSMHIFWTSSWKYWYSYQRISCWEYIKLKLLRINIMVSISFLLIQIYRWMWLRGSLRFDRIRMNYHILFLQETL